MWRRHTLSGPPIKRIEQCAEQGSDIERVGKVTVNPAVRLGVWLHEVLGAGEQIDSGLLMFRQVIAKRIGMHQ